jgi:hypothetical protein
VPGPIGGVVGAGCRVASEAALGDPSIRQAAEDTSHVLVGVHDVGRLAHQELHRILIPEPIRALNGVRQVEFPAIGRLGPLGDGLQRAIGSGGGERPDVVERGGDAPLGRAAMRP